MALTKAGAMLVKVFQSLIRHNGVEMRLQIFHVQCSTNDGSVRAGPQLNHHERAIRLKVAVC
ncbi:hypothetical protein CU103_15320 [Phyllobacterium sophorae]|uniref:Uncharacterized protein n=1 Tax=Phyllobacterium sophorae TaxID=1520277 RepID=A0A2P7BAY6_9HYPH|nr:hypothetical protein CU103_15320 [Phyllobacterium sophorae]